MSEPNWTEICECESAGEVVAQDYCRQATAPEQSPIDDYYTYVEDLLLLGDAKKLESTDTLGRLLLLGLVTGVELYFRSILAGVIRVCPVSRRIAADQLVPFGAVDFYGPAAVEWALFDTYSLAGADEIRTRTRKLLGIELQRANSSIEAAMNEFDKLCHFRHAAVHARGTLGRGNAVALGLAEVGANTAVHLTLPTLHAAGVACHSVVRAYNRFVFRKLVERWIGESVLGGTWTSDKARFTELFRLFRSRIDKTGPTNAYHAYRAVARSLPA